MQLQQILCGYYCNMDHAINMVYRDAVLMNILRLLFLGSLIIIAGQILGSEPTQAHTLKPVRVFQIGFSKCATSSLAAFFNLNGVPALHHDFGNLAISMHENAQAGKPLIAPEYNKYLVFTDMENLFDDPPINAAMLYFKELDRQYPGSKFILNTRNKKAWLKSRVKHPVNKNGKTNLLAENARMLKLSEKEVLDLWSKEWDQHHREVIAYFKDRPQDLLIFDIDVDTPQKIIDFFQDNYELDAQHYLHKNKTTKQTDETRVETIALFSKNYTLKPGADIFTQEIKNPGKIGVIVPVLDKLIQHAVNHLKKHGSLPNSRQLDFNSLNPPYVYRLKNWASDIESNTAITQTAYIQGYLNGLDIGLDAGSGGMFTCLLANRNVDLVANCFYQIKEM